MTVPGPILVPPSPTFLRAPASVVPPQLPGVAVAHDNLLNRHLARRTSAFRADAVAKKAEAIKTKREAFVHVPPPPKPAVPFHAPLRPAVPLDRPLREFRESAAFVNAVECVKNRAAAALFAFEEFMNNNGDLESLETLLNNFITEITSPSIPCACPPRAS